MSRSSSATPTITPEQLDEALREALRIARSRVERRVEHRHTARIGLNTAGAVEGRQHAARAGEQRKTVA